MDGPKVVPQVPRASGPPGYEPSTTTVCTHHVQSRPPRPPPSSSRPPAARARRRRLGSSQRLPISTILPLTHSPCSPVPSSDCPQDWIHCFVSIVRRAPVSFGRAIPTQTQPLRSHASSPPPPSPPPTPPPPSVSSRSSSSPFPAGQIPSARLPPRSYPSNLICKVREAFPCSPPYSPSPSSPTKTPRPHLNLSLARLLLCYACQRGKQLCVGARAVPLPLSRTRRLTSRFAPRRLLQHLEARVGGVWSVKLRPQPGSAQSNPVQSSPVQPGLHELGSAAICAAAAASSMPCY